MKTLTLTPKHEGSRKFETSHYCKKQKTIRRHMKNYMKKDNGIITYEQYKRVFPSDTFLKRLFIQQDNNTLQWKQSINSLEILSKKMHQKITPTDKIAQLFYHSRKLDNRTATPFLTHANNKILKNKDISIFEPLFGFDILIRPINTFNDSDEKNNNFVIGKNSFAIFIHCNIDQDGNFLVNNQFMIRANIGECALRYGIDFYINIAVTQQYDLLKYYIRTNNMKSLAIELCKTCNDSVRKWTFSGV